MDMEKSDTAIEIASYLELAQQLYKRYYARCFWHMKPDLHITEPLVALVIKGLRANGGREGFLAAARLAEWRDQGCR
jgi:hypothetical protein